MGTFMELPLVDFSAFLKNEGAVVGKQPTPSQIKVSQQIDSANRQHGFVLLRNSGIPKDALCNMFQKSETLFDLPNSYKVEKLKQLDPSTNSGYRGFHTEALNRRRSPDMKETFNYRSKDKEINLQNTPDGFPPVIEEFWESVKASAQKYSMACACALNLPIDYFSRSLTEYDLCTLRLNHYPPCDDPHKLNKEMDLSSSIRVGEHTDFGIFTFLFVKDFHSPESKGLQVKSVEGGDLTIGSNQYETKERNDGKEEDTDTPEQDNGDEEFRSNWRDVLFSEEVWNTIKDDETATVIVNTGGLMARWTNDTWLATAHRVVVSEETAASHRYSLACFFDPDKSYIISVDNKFVPVGEVPKYKPISSLDYVVMKVQEALGELPKTISSV